MLVSSRKAPWTPGKVWRVYTRLVRKRDATDAPVYADKATTHAKPGSYSNVAIMPLRDHLESNLTIVPCRLSRRQPDILHVEQSKDLFPGS